MGKTHGQTKTRLYRIWSGMKGRCNNKKNPAYRYYGAKGIKVCDEWQNDFLAFKEWADLNGYNDKLTIDRIDSDGDYCPSNCRWLTAQENSARTKFVKNNEEMKQKTSEGYLRWLREYANASGEVKRIKQINDIISALPTLGTGQLTLVMDYILWLQAQTESNKRKRAADRTIEAVTKNNLKEW